MSEVKTEQKNREKDEEGSSEICYVSCNVHDLGCQGKRCCCFFLKCCIKALPHLGLLQSINKCVTAALNFIPYRTGSRNSILHLLRIFHPKKEHANIYLLLVLFAHLHSVKMCC